MVGIVMLGLGIWVKVEREEYEEIVNYDYITIANIAIAAGIIMLVVAFFGFCGALLENSRVLLVVSVLFHCTMYLFSGIFISRDLKG